jgi:UDPglucose--hexose-1-phosphate uridylyltransferase
MRNPEIRECPFTGRQVIFAPQRAERPLTMQHTEPHHRSTVNQAYCPFCPGHEHDTPTAVLTIPGEHRWQQRIVPNKYPAVRPDSQAFGYHEVLIPCREHFTSPTELSTEQFSQLLLMSASRLRQFHADERIQSISVFQNVGAEAGASLAHLHSQLIALPFVPEELAVELDRSSRRTDCRFCTCVHQHERIVAESSRFLVVCPVASRFAYEMCVLPKWHQSRFEAITPEEAAELAELFQRVLRSLDEVLNVPAYNWLLHTSPRAETPHYHWHFEVIPRTIRVAGFEWGTGVFINSVFPEISAQQLRLHCGERA